MFLKIYFQSRSEIKWSSHEIKTSYHEKRLHDFYSRVVMHQKTQSFSALTRSFFYASLLVNKNRVHLQRNNLYVSQNIEQENLTVNQVLVPIFFQKQVIKTFLRQELFMSTFRLSKQMSKGTRSSTLFLYPCYYGENLQKLFLKYFFI